MGVKGFFRFGLILSALTGVFFLTSNATGADMTESDKNWDKVFAKSDMVDASKVSFKNRYGIELTGDLRQSSTVFDADYSTLSRYPDSAAISDWAREAVAMMTQYELMNGTSKGFEPKKEMTLEQCLVLLTRICEF